VIDQIQHRTAIAEEIPGERLIPPRQAPHFCQSLVLKYPNRVTLGSTIDPDKQSTCQRLAENHQQLLHSMDIHNVAMVVLDNASGDILAMIGSANFGDWKHDGQVNGALAPRSPGSTLKPFVYAQAIDSGLLSPQMRLADIPVDYDGYSPENYDEQYHGTVSLREALIRSFNVPAVKACDMVGVEQFHRFLRRGGLATVDKPFHHYGLPLVLGGCEVTLLDLSALYGALARDGKCVAPRWLANEAGSGVQSDSTDHLLSAEACYLVSDILAELHRPDLPTSWEFTKDMPRVAWKTGTSYGRRDAWAIGCNPHLTIGVWAGNFSGEGSVDLQGAKIAAPLMLSAFSKLAGENQRGWFARPPGIAVRPVCAATGQPPNDYCEHTVYEEYIPGSSPMTACEVHQLALVDLATGRRVSRWASFGRDVRQDTVAVWPPHIAGWLAAHGQSPKPVTVAPSIHVSSTATARPVITSPPDNGSFILLDDIPPQYQKILLEASVGSDSRTVHWFVDRRLLATAEVGERVFYTPSRGTHRVMCVDDLGRSGSVTIDVK
ncbi:penicillin-binding protein 1C, partial [candidate division GN15 bacterium]|nr:penicillin-binding protein 1C [candidate division GN15 bacterium]